MKTVIWLSICVFGITLAACQPGTPSQQTQPATTADKQEEAVIRLVTPSEFEELLTQTPEAQLIDVRTAREVEEGSLPKAGNIDIKADNFQAHAKGLLDPAKPVFVFCKSGMRSTKAAGVLESMGYTEIYNMEGGFLRWKDEGRETVKP